MKSPFEFSKKEKSLFRQPSSAEKQELKSVFENHIYGTDIYTYVCLHPEDENDSRLWTEYDKSSKLKSVFYDDGSYYLKAYPEKNTVSVCLSVKGKTVFDKPEIKNRLYPLEFNGKASKKDTRPVFLYEKQLFDVFKLLANTENLPDYIQKRYVDTVRGVNAGLCAYCGIFENGELVSCGGVVAKNNKFALLGNIYTNPDYRNLGYATAVINTLSDYCNQKNLTPVLYCERKNINFYKNIGFSRR